jgi:hypothetical protein
MVADGTDNSQEAFSENYVSEELYRPLWKGMQVCIKHSPHLHFVYALEPGDA